MSHSDRTKQATQPDLNALLSEEQSAIMRAEAATDVHVRDTERDSARHYRHLIDSTDFPAREPHDFEAIIPAQQRALDFEAEFEELQRCVAAMDRSLALAFADGRVGTRSNTFEHRSRLVRQGHVRLEALRERLPEGVNAIESIER